MKKNKGNKQDMEGPLYSSGDGNTLGPHKVEGPRGGLTTPDTIGFGHGILRKGPGGKKLQDHNDKE